jgi:hypothetical protein
MDWTFAVPPVLLELSLRTWINIGFVAGFLTITAVAVILTSRLPASEDTHRSP